MAILYTKVLSGERIVATDLMGPHGHYVVTDIPFEDWTGGTLRLSIAGGQSTFDDNTDHGGLITAIVADPGQDQTSPLDGTIAQLKNYPEEANFPAGAGNGYTPLDFSPNGVGDTPIYVEFAAPGTAKHLYFWAPISLPGFVEVTAYFRDYTITIEGDAPPPALEVEITDPPDGNIGPDDALTFVVENDGLPSVLTADVTLCDGSVERAWDYDQAVNGYVGSIDVDGTTRTYTIRRPIGWPLGSLGLTVTARV